jgi:outer membrane protein OmpA-like peptidoglycan-associated protein
LGKTIEIQVRGNHDPLGSEDLNSALARTRVENVRAALVTLGIPAAILTAVSEDLEKETCSAVKEADRMFCLSASFRVIGVP